MTATNNPQISTLLRFLTFVEVLVLFVTGLGLFFVPKLIEPFWPWELLPFNARFLGAVYTTSLIAAAMQVYYARWSPTRVVTPMIFIFTAVIILLSFVHINEFDFQRPEVWLWFLLYIVLPINAGYHIWLYRNLQAGDPARPTNAGRTILLTQALILGIYGLALLLIPSVAKTLWSWEIDDFLAQLYSVTFLAPAVGAFMLAKAASKIEWLTMGLTQAVLGLFPIIGVIVVNATVKGVDWSSAGTWIWMVLFAAMFMISLWMIKESQTKINS
jgi:hypothetical protein